MIKTPNIYPITKLPLFVQECAMSIWEEAGIKPENMKAIVFTYFDGIYTSHQMPQDLFVHESVHFKRQGAGLNEETAKAWWIAYRNDKNFRYEEELMAYREQYKFLLKKFNKPVAFEHAKRLAKDLSGPIYGNLLSETDALFAIIKS